VGVHRTAHVHHPQLCVAPAHAHCSHNCMPSGHHTHTHTYPSPTPLIAHVLNHLCTCSCVPLLTLLQVDLHRHLTGSLPNGRVLDILAETTSAKDGLVPTGVSAAASPQPPPPPPMVTPAQGVSAAAQHDAWDLLIRQCAAVQTASASSDDNFRRLVTEAVEELARDNVVCAEPPISSTLSCALHCILLHCCVS